MSARRRRGWRLPAVPPRITAGLLYIGGMTLVAAVAAWPIYRSGAFVLLVVARVSARAIARRLTAVERCLVIGDPVMAERIRIKMADSHVKAAVVGGIAMPD